MTWPATVLGALLVLGILREVFHTLFHPAGRGGPTMSVFRVVWAATGRIGSRGRPLAGPIAMVLVILLWTFLLVVGWALVYWPAMPGNFIFASPLVPTTHNGFDDALYLSAVTQATLGYGDIAPQSDLMRVLAPLQAILGFAVFTAAITWVLSVYPALQRQRATASFAHAIHAANAARPTPTPDSVAARRMERLAEALSHSRVDLVQFPSTFYFAAPDPTFSLAEALPDVQRLSTSGGGPEAADAAAELASALDALAATLDQYLSAASDDTDGILAAYRRHHAVAKDEEPA